MDTGLKINDSSSPTTSLGGVMVLLTIGSVFGLVAVWPYAPPFDSLAGENARIQKVWKENFSSTTSSLITNAGNNVKCIYSKSGGCDPATMKSLMESKIPIWVWHDGGTVYQLATQDKIILPYEHVNQGRWLAGGFSIISFLVAFIQLAVRKGLIGVGKKENAKS
jgi:hypothetical protein